MTINWVRDHDSSAIRYPDSKVHGANMGPSWGRQDPGGSHVGPMNFAIWVHFTSHMIRQSSFTLTHWGRVTHICVNKLTIIGSDNGLSPNRRQAIIWTNAGLLLIGPLGTNFSEILIELHSFSFKKMHVKMLSAKRRPFCLGLNVLRYLACSIRPNYNMIAVFFPRLR